LKEITSFFLIFFLISVATLAVRKFVPFVLERKN
jgi:hypothetical protein